MSDDLRATVRDLMPALRSDLEDLVRIQSVSADPARTGEVWRSAEAVADLFRAEGFAEVDIVSADGGAPAVIAHKTGPEGAPTVLLYAHHDVQPENDHGRLGLPAVRADRAGRPALRPRRRRRQGRDRGAPRRAPGVRRRPAGQRRDVHRGRGGGRLRHPARAAEGAPGQAARRRDRDRRLRQLGHRRARARPPRCAAWSAPTSRCARSATPSTPACGAAWCPTRS